MKLYSLIKFHTLLTAIILVFNSCSKEDAKISNDPNDLSGDWKVAYFLDNGNKITKTEKNTWPDVNNGDITASFTITNDNGSGTISGISVTNNYHGEYTILENGKINIEGVYSTYIAEPEWTSLYRLHEVENFEIKNGMLLISYNNGKNIIAFQRT
ncbi:hypothetical protein MHTCC0001_25090 [Flavobacteriaceae bacterium MHTCC 0001]